MDELGIMLTRHTGITREVQQVGQGWLLEKFIHESTMDTRADSVVGDCIVDAGVVDFNELSSITELLLLKNVVGGNLLEDISIRRTSCTLGLAIFSNPHA